ncbi:hypothetical protein [Rhizobium sp. ZPR3]|uniref:Uncharacterized protein n=2 Tax=unclassified Rhizobium TaxID=2613769 RepID=A0AAU7SQG6_9HYPH
MAVSLAGPNATIVTAVAEDCIWVATIVSPRIDNIMNVVQSSLSDDKQDEIRLILFVALYCEAATAPVVPADDNDLRSNHFVDSR